LPRRPPYCGSSHDTHKSLIDPPPGWVRFAKRTVAPDAFPFGQHFRPGPANARSCRVQSI
jgi:hypothetical protein